MPELTPEIERELAAIDDALARVEATGPEQP